MIWVAFVFGSLLPRSASLYLPVYTLFTIHLSHASHIFRWSRNKSRAVYDSILFFLSPVVMVHSQVVSHIHWRLSMCVCSNICICVMCVWLLFVEWCVWLPWSCDAHHIEHSSNVRQKMKKTKLFFSLALKFDSTLPLRSSLLLLRLLLLQLGPLCSMLSLSIYRSG